MDSRSIIDAARNGDLDFLRKAFDDNIGDLPSYFLGCEDSSIGNLLHVAVERGHYSFLYDALDILSVHPTLVMDLLCQTEGYGGCNPLHVAASGGNIFIVKLLGDAYASAVASDSINEESEPPWLQMDWSNNTPLRRCFFTDRWSQEAIARYLVSRDQSWLTSMGEGHEAMYSMDECSTLILDSQNTSIVCNAMEAGCSIFVEQILTSNLPYSLNGNALGYSPLHYASRCNEKASKLLLKKHPELLKEESLKGETVLDRAIEDGATWLVRLMLIEDESLKFTDGNEATPWIKACRRLIWHKNATNGDTPLHIAARKGYSDIAELVIQGYRSAIQDVATELDGLEAQPVNYLLGAIPVYIMNSVKEIPLLVALANEHDECAVMLSNETFPLTAHQVTSGLHWQALFTALNNSCGRSVKTLIAEIVIPGSVKCVIGNGHGVLSPCVIEIFHWLYARYGGDLLKSEEMEKLLEVLPGFLKEPGKDPRTCLKEASGRGEDWLVTLFLTCNKYSIMDCAPAWEIACEKGYKSTLITILDRIDHQLFIDLCRSRRQTPLHHLKLLKCDEYLELLKMPLLKVFLNQIDFNWETPLHRAIRCKDLELTKALLETEGIDVSIRDRSRITAFGLLENHCEGSQSWSEQYKKMLKMPVVTKKLINETDSDGATPLHRAIQRDDLELTKALLEIAGIDVSIRDISRITAFGLLENYCEGSQSWSEQYMKMLKMPVVTKKLINETDSDGATPLHRAIQRDDLELTKALLEIAGVNVGIRNRNGATALDLLENRCKISNSWGKMCREIQQDSTVQSLKYLFRKISFEGMQNTLSVVAALVATITFAAGITIPGGYNNNDGTAILSTQTSFLVFSISNTIAMCSSIMVLFLLLGPMIWDPQPSLFYVNWSLFLLLLSLGGTVLAFMTGVYVTLIDKVKWNAIFVVVTCSFTLFVACIVLFSTHSSRFNNQVCILSNWVKKLFNPNPLHPLGNTTIQRTPSCSSNPETPPTQAQSGSTNTQGGHVPDVATSTTAIPSIQAQSGSTNTLVTQSSDMQLTSYKIPSDLESGSMITPATQASGSPVTTPELALLEMQTKEREIGQSSGTSSTIPEDFKIEIKSN